MIEEKIDEITQKVRRLLRFNHDILPLLDTEPYARIQKTGDSYKILSIFFEDVPTGKILYVLPIGACLYDKNIKDNPYRYFFRTESYEDILAMN